jgi:uncharacterized membrane protein YoaK (UPF0700 family)
MHSVAVSFIVFGCVFAAAVVGMVVRVPQEHLGADAKDVVRLATGLVATMAAMVLGMLVSSAKTAYDTSKNDVAVLSSDIIAIDHLLVKYGPETAELRADFRQTVMFGVDRVWPNQRQETDLRPTDRGENISNGLELLTPKDERQAAVKTQALSMVSTLRQTQWLLFLKSQQNAVPFPLLAVLVIWLAAIFLSFGLFAAPNSTTVVALVLCALAVSAAIFIMLEMYTPFSGVLRISPTPILEAVKQMQH